ncbi:MAG: ABC transporter ATP-binding protein [Anaerolineaceae bacterium]|nr:ABC transporter ATP-binding protein [Anaerolineae bacterium]MBL1172922.1 ABC transporter ATP-binding protein [Chloroflexota bacterium]MCL4822808.1 ABC transporter ATP-binding protein [Anaerolineales bacterium]GJQ37891.1 MAG: ABC transporter ATP-binding protein [Anaerolineaceae bacterium]NOG76418.1 ABC transporter ATP-binding protein [Chloroflexota bacterium]
MSNIVLETKNLTKTFGVAKAVDSVNITAYEGEVFGFLGPNGAGKTTTLGMTLGLVHPTSGEARVLGQRVTPDRTAALKNVGALLGAPAFVPYLSARKNVELVSRLTPGVNGKRIAEVLELVGLGKVGRKRVSRFSTGMKQRVGLAMALVHRPRFVILDEPTSGLDPAGMREIRQLLRSLAEHGTSVLLSSHLLNEVQQICDRIAIINHGRIVAQGRVDELLNGQKPGVRVTVSDVESAVRALEALANVSVQTNGSSLTISGADSQTVMNHLLQNHIIPTEVAVQKNDLEALFMDVTSAK